MKDDPLWIDVTAVMRPGGAEAVMAELGEVISRFRRWSSQRGTVGAAPSARARRIER